MATELLQVYKCEVCGNIVEVLNAGATRGAVCSAVCSADDPQAAAEAIRKQLA